MKEFNTRLIDLIAYVFEKDSVWFTGLFPHEDGEYEGIRKR